MIDITSTHRLTLDLPPSCVAFCPTRPEFFVVGTYYLHGNTATISQPAVEGEASDGPSTGADDVHDEPQVRSGSLILYGLQGEETVHVATKPTPDSAVLDLQWSPHISTDGELLAAATSTGLLAFYKLQSDHGTTHLVSSSVKRVCETSILVLSLAWHPSRAGVIGATLSDGRVCLCEITDNQPWTGEAPLSVTTVHLHSLEAWTLAFGPQADGSSILSGGDDLVLQQSNVAAEQMIVTAWQDRKIHQAGVTAILPLASHLILTGSYDDHIRLVSVPSAGRRHVLAEADLGGGVWRLKLLGEQPAEEGASGSTALSNGTTSLIILASCMHAGTRIVALSRGQDGYEFEVLARFGEHKSMNYGSDAQPDLDAVKTIVSTSFYDKLLCLWRFDTATL